MAARARREGASGRCRTRGAPDRARSRPGGRGGSPGRWDAGALQDKARRGPAGQGSGRQGASRGSPVAVDGRWSGPGRGRGERRHGLLLRGGHRCAGPGGDLRGPVRGGRWSVRGAPWRLCGPWQRWVGECGGGAQRYGWGCRCARCGNCVVRELRGAGLRGAVRALSIPGRYQSPPGPPRGRTRKAWQSPFLQLTSLSRGLEACLLPGRFRARWAGRWAGRQGCFGRVALAGVWWLPRPGETGRGSGWPCRIVCRSTRLSPNTVDGSGRRSDIGARPVSVPGRSPMSQWIVGHGESAFSHMSGRHPGSPGSRSWVRR